MSHDDHHQQHHLNLNARAILIMFPTYVDATLLDISMDGALLLLDEPFSLGRGTPCTLRVLTADGHQAVELEASVIYSEQDLRLGLALNPVPPSAAPALRRLIEANPAHQAVEFLL